MTTLRIPKSDPLRPLNEIAAIKYIKEVGLSGAEKVRAEMSQRVQAQFDALIKKDPNCMPAGYTPFHLFTDEDKKLFHMALLGIMLMTPYESPAEIRKRILERRQIRKNAVKKHR